MLLEYGTTNPQIIAYDQKMASDTTPGFTLFSKVLTTSDKEMAQPNIWPIKLQPAEQTDRFRVQSLRVSSRI